MTPDTPQRPKGILTPEDTAALSSMTEGDVMDCGAVLEKIGSIISAGVAQGRFTEKDAHRDLEVALWVAYACNNMQDYEHFYTSCQWLSGVEDLAAGCGVWYYRYANALMYCGRPALALEYCERGIREDPSYPWTWLTLGRLRAHFGDVRGAYEAGRTGIGMLPDDHEFLTLLADIESGATIEQMEMHFIDPDEDANLASLGPEHPEYGRRMLAAEGIVCNRANLDLIKRTLGISVMSADHPYCTHLMERPSGPVMVTFMMSEAQLSKRDPEALRRIYDALDGMDARARQFMEEKGRTGHDTLAGMSIGPGLDVRLTYASGDPEDIVVVDFDQSLEIQDNSGGGPFAAIVLLKEARWDPRTAVDALRDRWGIVLDGAEVEGDTIIGGLDGHIVAISLVRAPVPGEEAEEAAAANYMWPEARDAAQSHRAHLVVALVNHGGDPVQIGATFAKVVDSCIHDPNVLGIYTNDTVYRPEYYAMETDALRRSGANPAYIMVWVGMYRTSEGVCAYTVGMRSYARDEMEVVNAQDEPFNVMNFLYDIVQYLLDNDARFTDGDTFGFLDGQTLHVTRGKGVSVYGVTLKMEYPRRSRLGFSI